MIQELNHLTLELQPEPLAIVRLAPNEPIPTWALEPSRFTAIARTQDELSIVCADAKVSTPPGLKCERPWRALKVKGPLDFALTGILARLAGTLAQAGIPIFAISTFDTDYLLVKGDTADAACASLRAAGYTVLT